MHSHILLKLRYITLQTTTLVTLYITPICFSP